MQSNQTYKPQNKNAAWPVHAKIHYLNPAYKQLTTQAIM